MKQRRRQHRSKKRAKRKPKQLRKPSAPPTSVHHPRFGDIPLIDATIVGLRGEEYAYLTYDPDYKPSLPRNAVRANPRIQVSWGGVPLYYYVDETRSCVQCQQDFVFRAREQKYWYESLQFPIANKAIRCLRCRRRRRSKFAVMRALQGAVEAVATTRDDPSALLQLAEATVAHVERLREGGLDRAIAACRKVQRSHPQLPEAAYWEARCHDLAGRRAKARECLRRFLERAPRKGRLRRMVQRAESRLAPKKSGA